MPASRIILLLTSALLSGCNLVTSREPWFGPDDAKGAPSLRSGVWMVSADPNCRVNGHISFERWPACAHPMLVRDNDLVVLDREDRVHPAWLSYPHVLSATDPRVLQLRVEGQNPPYGYLAFVPVSLDSEGQIVRYRTFFIACDGRSIGMRAKEGVAGSDVEPAATPQTLPGLHDVEGAACEADDMAGLVSAARVNMANPEMAFQYAGFVRDGDR